MNSFSYLSLHSYIHIFNLCLPHPISLPFALHIIPDLFFIPTTHVPLVSEREVTFVLCSFLLSQIDIYPRICGLNWTMIDRCFSGIWSARTSNALCPRVCFTHFIHLNNRLFTRDAIFSLQLRHSLFRCFLARHQTRSTLDCGPIAWGKSHNQWQHCDRCQWRQAFIKHQVVHIKEIRILVICFLLSSIFSIFPFSTRIHIYIYLHSSQKEQSRQQSLLIFVFFIFLLPTFLSIFDVCILCSYRACVFWLADCHTF